MNSFWSLLIPVGILQVSVLFTTIYLHRCLCHRGLDLHPALANLMHLELSLFTGVAPREWVAVHRKHHHFSDREGDPHSPYLHGLWQVFFGNYFYYKREIRNRVTILKYTPDYRPDFVDRIPFIRYGVLGGMMIFCLVGCGVWRHGVFMWWPTSC